jgi:hypothetical protein
MASPMTPAPTTAVSTSALNLALYVNILFQTGFPQGKYRHRYARNISNPY